MKKTAEWSMAFDPEGKTLASDPNESLVKQKVNNACDKAKKAMKQHFKQVKEGQK